MNIFQLAIWIASMMYWGWIVGGGPVMILHHETKEERDPFTFTVVPQFVMQIWKDNQTVWGYIWVPIIIGPALVFYYLYSLLGLGFAYILKLTPWV